MSTALVKLETAKQALAEARTVDEVKEVRDKAEALRLYVKQQGYGLEIQNDIAEIKLRAERRAGELLAEIDKAKGGNPKLQSILKPTGDTLSPVALEDLGISKKQSSRWQLEAEVPEEEFERHVAGIKAAKEELTSVGVRDLAKKLRREDKRAQRLAHAPEAVEWTGEFKLDTVQIAAISDLWLLPNESVDLVFTDPPYHEGELDLYDELGQLASRVLKPGAYCITYCGKMFLPEVIEMLEGHLEYVWISAVFHPFSQSRINKHRLFENWRPILFFKKAGQTACREWVQDVVRGKRDKKQHDWQQDLEAPLQYIPAYTEIGDIVLDPFVGGGTTPAACIQLGRHFLAFDKDEEAVRLTARRIKSAREATAEVPQPG